jgi:putative hydrolase of the HAD superfamily
MTSPPDIKAVMFDYGGVLADSPFSAFVAYERERDLPQGFIRTLNATNPHDNAWARLERNEVTFEEFCDAFEAEAELAGGRVDARALFAKFTGTLRPDMVEAVRRCSTRFKTALLTNNFVNAESVTAGGDDLRAELMSMFHVVIESSVVGLRKPDPRFYLVACGALEVDPTEAVFLDDLGINLKPARGLGMMTIKVESTEAAIAELEEVLGTRLR